MRNSYKNIDPSLYYIPPHNLDAEEGLLSAVLIDNEAMVEIADSLTPRDFYRQSHQKIYAAQLDLFNAEEPIDLITLSDRLKQGGELEAVGGATQIAALVDAVPMAANIPYYAKIIREKASLRRLIENVHAIFKRCYADQGEVEKVISFAESSIYEISQGNLGPDFSELKTILDDNITALEKQQANPESVNGIPSGFAQLDAMTAGFQKSDLIILAARPGMGKTTLALNIARNAAIQDEAPVLVFSLEMSKDQLSMRMLCSEAGIDSSRARNGFLGRGDWNAINTAAGVLTEAPIYIDDSPDITQTTIRAKARRLQKDKGLGMIIIDYIQLMRSSQSAERRDLEISQISRALKGIAKEFKIPVIALSQLNRKLEERNDKRPMLSDLRESGALEQDADVVAFIYRDDVYNKDNNNPNLGMAELIVAKQRNGPVGMVPMRFLSAYTRFESAESAVGRVN